MPPNLVHCDVIDGRQHTDGCQLTAADGSHQPLPQHSVAAAGVYACWQLALATLPTSVVKVVCTGRHAVVASHSIRLQQQRHRHRHPQQLAGVWWQARAAWLYAGCTTRVCVWHDSAPAVPVCVGVDVGVSRPRVFCHRRVASRRVHALVVLVGHAHARWDARVMAPGRACVVVVWRCFALLLHRCPFATCFSSSSSCCWLSPSLLSPSRLQRRQRLDGVATGTLFLRHLRTVACETLTHTCTRPHADELNTIVEPHQDLAGEVHLACQPPPRCAEISSSLRPRNLSEVHTQCHRLCDTTTAATAAKLSRVITTPRAQGWRDTAPPATHPQADVSMRAQAVKGACVLCCACAAARRGRVCGGWRGRGVSRGVKSGTGAP